MALAFLDKIKWKHIFLLLLCFLCMMAIMRHTAAQVKNISGGTSILDLNFGNSPQHISHTISTLGEAGRKYYQTHFLIVDFFYAMVYALFYFWTILFLLHKNQIRKKSLFNACIFPIVGMLFDWLENLFICLLIKNWTNQSELLCTLFNISNIIKFLFVYLSLLVVVLCFLYYFFQKICHIFKFTS